MPCMKHRNWTRRLMLATVWAMAMSTWSSIGHHVFGLVDLGPVLTGLAAAVVLLWPVQVSGPSKATGGETMQAQPGAPSRA